MTGGRCGSISWESWGESYPFAWPSVTLLTRDYGGPAYDALLRSATSRLAASAIFALSFTRQSA
jgi:hypothetical protein